MSDRPWLEDADPSLRLERSLLKKLNAQQPPSGSVDHGWAALAAEISGLEALGASGAHQAAQVHAAAHGMKGGASLIIAAKIAAGVAVAGGVLWGGSALLAPDSSNVSTRRVAPTNVPALTASVQEQLAEQVTGQAPEEDRASVKAPQSTGMPRPASSATTLAEEGRLLAQAHQLVQSGSPAQALDVLRLSASRYPRSVLYQEREVLTIEALGATGASAAARQRAERFLKRYPNSPHAGRLKRFVE